MTGPANQMGYLVVIQDLLMEQVLILTVQLWTELASTTKSLYCKNSQQRHLQNSFKKAVKRRG